MRLRTGLPRGIFSAVAQFVITRTRLWQTGRRSTARSILYPAALWTDPDDCFAIVWLALGPRCTVTSALNGQPDLQASVTRLVSVDLQALREPWSCIVRKWQESSRHLICIRPAMC